MLRGRLREEFDLFEQVVDGAGSFFLLGAEEGVLESGEAIEGTFCIDGFCGAVGVEEEGIARLEREGGGFERVECF